MSIHAIDRAMERYGIHITLSNLREAEGRIERGQSLLVDGKDADEQTHIMRICGKPVRVVFVQSARRIITFLPYEVPRYRPRPLAMVFYQRNEIKQARHREKRNRQN